MDEKLVLGEAVGLTKNESSVYLFVLENGPVKISEIADKIHVHRVNLYDLLKRLSEKGLVSFIVEGRSKLYSASEPYFLLKNLEEKESMLREILPQLELKKESPKHKSIARVFQGKSGIKAILEDVLRENEEVYVYGAQGNFAETLPIYFQQFNKRRLKDKIRIKIIHSEKVREWRQKNPIPLSTIKYIHRFYDSPSTTFIYSNKIAIVMWVIPPIGILIESKELAESYLNFFKILWGIGKK